MFHITKYLLLMIFSHGADVPAKDSDVPSKMEKDTQISFKTLFIISGTLSIILIMVNFIVSGIFQRKFQEQNLEQKKKQINKKPKYYYITL